MAAPDPSWTVLEEGAVFDMPDHVYYADPVPVGSLSQSGAKLLLPPNTPKHFAHYRDNPKPSSRAQQLGTAAHARLLGLGPKVVVLPEKVTDYKTAKAQAIRDEAIAAGAVPLLYEQDRKVRAMAKALREDEYVSALLDPDHGRAEVAIFWIDPETGVWCRMKTDWLPEPNAHGEVTVVDYKTVGRQAHVSVFARQLFDLGYYLQNVWYRAGVAAIPTLSPYRPPTFVWIVQETEPPFAAQIFELDPLDEHWGEKQMRRALRLYARCTATGQWPGHPRGIQRVSIPRWGQYQLRDAERDGAFFDAEYDTPTPGPQWPVYDDTYRGWDVIQ